MAKDWEREKQKAWARQQKLLNFYAPPALRQIIEEDLPDVDDQTHLEDYEGVLGDRLNWAKCGAILSYLPPAKRSHNPTTTRRPGFLQKQVYLVRFIIEQQIGSRKLGKRIRKRINWKKTSETWNTAHPNDPRSPRALKKTFYRAISLNDVQREFQKEMGIFISEALWVGRLSQVLDDVDLILKWAVLFSLREVTDQFIGKAPDGEQRQLEVEAVNNPDSIARRLDETMRKRAALMLGIDLHQVNKMSRKELIESLEHHMKRGGAK